MRPTEIPTPHPVVFPARRPLPRTISSRARMTDETRDRLRVRLCGLPETLPRSLDYLFHLDVSRRAA